MDWCAAWRCAARRSDIRLALNISQSRATQIARSVACYQGAGLQHAAFACRDLPAACDQLAEVARHTLPIPANYYDDLLARFGGELDVGQLQRQQLLYDRDPQGRFPASLHPALYRWPLFL